MDLAKKIRDELLAGNYVISDHAEDMLRERGVELWQIEAGVSQWKMVEIRPGDLPNPSIVVSQLLADGTEVTVVWSWYDALEAVNLVMVHYLDDDT